MLKVLHVLLYTGYCIKYLFFNNFMFVVWLNMKNRFIIIKTKKEKKKNTKNRAT